jgi:8-oxo-dGTP pyrophosphatase MutT (NUDIX family)
LTEEELPIWLYCALTRKQMRQAIAQKGLKSSNTHPLLLTENLQKLRRSRKKAQSVMIRIAARAAARAGSNFELYEGSYWVDRLSIEHFSCGKLSGRYQKLQRVDTAGGLVLRPNQEVEILLLLKREGDNMEWVLPKGRRKPGERRRQTALREVKEETGIAEIKVKKFLGREGYFVINSKRVTYKRVSYYLMYCANPVGEPLKVRTVEGFVEGRWVSLEEAMELTNPTRAYSILDTLRELFRKNTSPRPAKQKKVKKKKSEVTQISGEEDLRAPEV